MIILTKGADKTLRMTVRDRDTAALLDLTGLDIELTFDRVAITKTVGSGITILNQVTFLGQAQIEFPRTDIAKMRHGPYVGSIFIEKSGKRRLAVRDQWTVHK